jgi:uncharacterized protein DUF4124
MSFVIGFMLRSILSAGFCIVLLAAAPAFAQVFKWVDDKGVVNYSDEAPASRNSRQLDPKSTRVSTYTTDDAQKRAATTLASANESALSEKIDRLERKLDAERYARNLSDAQMQTAANALYERCVRDRRVDCDYAGTDPYPYYDTAYYPYYYGTVVAARPHRVHPRPMVPRQGTAPKPAPRSASSSGRMGLPRQM